jgi:DNA-binding transcriptional regulator YiaG
VVTNEQVRVWRWEHRLSQAQLAEHLHVTVLTVKRWESGNTAPPEFLRLALERLDDLLQGARALEETPR